MYEDDYFRNHTWIRDGKEHWVFSRPEFLKLVQNPDFIYWTPNTIASDVSITGNAAHISLNSEIPNLKEYQMRYSSGDDWMPVNNPVDLKLKKSKYEILFRTLNVAGVTGPEHRLVIERK